MEAAEDALMEAGVYNGEYFIVKYASADKRPPTKSRPATSDYGVDADVQAELDAMSNSGSVPTEFRNPPPPVTTQSQFMGRPQAAPPQFSNSNDSRRPQSRPKPITGNEIREKIDPSLLELIRKPAITSDDKYRVLDARDKLIRLRTKKTTDITKVVSTKGTCPDMCPEKERLQRIAQHQVGTYEWEDESRSVMNHRLAVKQYSRSSADQESPLPHELRPESVLRMTMDYLLVRIVNLSENDNVSMADWFHFMWDRTRGIRKDITQQELCSLESVKLVEQCARFHIHCAGRLVAEDVTVCDPKINTENLTKCLQSLKYMYHDLGLRGIVCPNEAEFRAYVILLNLHDSNFLWDFKEYPEAIRRSAEVKFAIDVYLAMANSNYVRFFNLVRSTSYMNACVLLRYFTQMRNLALQIIVKTYGTPKNIIVFPIESLSNILAFEDESACVQFLEFNGLICENGNVALDRVNFYYPDETYLMDRAINVVESKRDCSVGQAIYGGPFDGDFKFEKHVPHNSFGADNVLLRSAYDAKDQIHGSEVSKDENMADDLYDDASNGDSNFGAVMEKDNNSINLFDQVEDSEPSELFPISSKQNSNQFTESSQKPENNIFGSGGNQVIASQKKLLDNNIFELNIPKHKTQTIQNKSDTSSIFKIPSVPQKPGLFSSAAFGNVKTSIFQEANSQLKPSHNQSQFVNPKPLSSNFEMSAFGQSDSKSIFGNAARDVFEKTNHYSKTADVPVDFFKKHFTAIPANTSESGGFFKPHPKHEATSIFQQEPTKIDSSSFNKVSTPNKVDETEIINMRQKLLVELEEKRLHKEAISRIEKESENISDQLLNDCLHEFLETFAAKEIEKFTENSERIADQILENCLLEMIEEYCVEEVLLLEAIQMRNEMIMQRYFNRWKAAVIKARQRREFIESTPVWLVNEKLDEKAKNVAHPGQSSALMNMRRYRHGFSSAASLPSNHRADIKINVFDLIGSSLINRVNKKNTHPKSHIYWKAAVSVPEDSEAMYGIQSFFNKYLEDAFLCGINPNESGCFLLDQQSPKGCSEKVAICLRKFSGVDCNNEAGNKSESEMYALNALILIATGVDLKVARHRLRMILFNSKSTDPIPIVIIVYNSMNRSPAEIHKFLKLDELIEMKYVSDVKINVFNEVKDSFTGLLHSSLLFCAQNYSYESLLEMQPTTLLLRTLLGDEYWKRVISTIYINETFKEATLDFSFCIKLHNENVDRVINLIKHETELYPNFPKELKCFVPDAPADIPLELEHFPSNWKINRCKELMASFLESIKLKCPFDVGLSKSGSFADLEKFQEFIFKYAGSLRCSADLCNKIALHCIEVSLRQISSINADSFSEKMGQFSWLHCIEVFAVELLTLEYQRKCMELPNDIVYNRFQFDELSKTPWWFSSQLMDLKKISHQRKQDRKRLSLTKSTVDEKRPRLDDKKISASEIDEIIARGWASVKKMENNISHICEMAKTTEDITKDLDRDILEHERRTREMKRSIQSILRN